jgi:hypothetical protein
MSENDNPGQTAIILGALAVLLPLVLGLVAGTKQARGFTSLPSVEIMRPPNGP